MTTERKPYHFDQRVIDDHAAWVQSNALKVCPNMTNIDKNFAENTRKEDSKYVKLDLWFTNCSHIKLVDATLILANFYGVDFSHAHFVNCDFSHASLKECNFHEATFEKCTFDCTNMDRSSLTRTDVVKCLFKRTTLAKSNLQTTRFKNSHLINVSFENASGRDAFFDDCTLEKINFVDANFSYACFTNTRINKTKLSHTNLINSKFYDSALIDVSIHHANFTGSIFKNSSWNNVHGNNIDLYAVYITKFSFRGCEITDSNLLIDEMQDVTLLRNEDMVNRIGWSKISKELMKLFKQNPDKVTIYEHNYSPRQEADLDKDELI